MQSKRFRSYTFYPGDLVRPIWSKKSEYGVVVSINDNGRYPTVSVLWQKQKVLSLEREHFGDLEVVSRVDLD